MSLAIYDVLREAEGDENQNAAPANDAPAGGDQNQNQTGGDNDNTKADGGDDDFNMDVSLDDTDTEGGGDNATPADDTGDIDAPIGRDPNNRKIYTVTDQNSKDAITEMFVVKRYVGYTLVKCSLKTGRTHQIRVHMKYIGYPLYNDPVYNNKNATSFGQFLHSCHLEFNHPVTHEFLSFDAPLPNEFQSFIDNLEEITKI